MVRGWNFEEIDLKGAYLIDPFFSTDERGGFIKDYNIEVFKEHSIEHTLQEVFYTISKKGVIRALHFQLHKQQPKLVRCIRGHIYDVLVDLRPESRTYGQWRGIHLTGDNLRSLLVPAYFGHGYLVIEDSIVSYKAAETFYADGDSGIKYNDPDIGIEWPYDLIGGEEKVIISERDKKLMSLKEYSELMEK